MTADRIRAIEAIGPAFAERLRSAQIESRTELLSRCGEALGREAVGAATGIGKSLLLHWVRLADLMRIAGIDSQYAELLLAAGISSAADLRDHVPDRLRSALCETNRRERLAMTDPSVTVVEDWIRQAEPLSPCVRG